jgi:hypothetical protein
MLGGEFAEGVLEAGSPVATLDACLLICGQAFPRSTIGPSS